MEAWVAHRVFAAHNAGGCGLLPMRACSLTVAANWGVQAVYTSPLTRTMQTACLVFEHVDVRIVAWPIVTGV